MILSTIMLTILLIATYGNIRIGIKFLKITVSGDQEAIPIIKHLTTKLGQAYIVTSIFQFSTAALFFFSLIKGGH